MRSGDQTTAARGGWRLWCWECDALFYSEERKTVCPICGVCDLFDDMPETWDEDEDDE